ncbi:uncharacterized protein PGTG_21215 [Puccinia graminis f. sp. tritici CRL 75-36-700-3]|uniref:Uncharacterized protein n=1 Tax=Puccinia graminis f. sp. tritici (strain CRL 75-36-700-3 / race SCCL) TaxID=418459 RepID=H6QQN3_PUCGT|nr:uncharacterized protein PGTG_21215 [Puccinia graminis f. sp. tritici CRL 75-36-700-3]EHS62751.1 hypothetical protein PGTG_21215 [Puccinia graminis f. sp. tritici CRL 75-36-700-3]
MINSQVVLLAQQHQLCITHLHHQLEQDVWQRTLESLFSQDSANKNQEIEDAVMLFMAMAYFGTPMPGLPCGSQQLGFHHNHGY